MFRPHKLRRIGFLIGALSLVLTFVLGGAFGVFNDQKPYQIPMGKTGALEQEIEIESLNQHYKFLTFNAIILDHPESLKGVTVTQGAGSPWSEVIETSRVTYRNIQLNDGAGNIKLGMNIKTPPDRSLLGKSAIQQVNGRIE